MLNTAIATNQPIFPLNLSVEKKQYKTDPFTLIDGRYVGHDGFVVPKDFNEFHQRFPHHIPNWVKRHGNRLALKEDLEDWTQDLARIIHIFEDNKSLLCYKHVDKTMFAVTKEASECLTIAQHSVCCSQEFFAGL